MQSTTTQTILVVAHYGIAETIHRQCRETDGSGTVNGRITANSGMGTLNETLFVAKRYGKKNMTVNDVTVRPKKIKKILSIRR